MERLSGTDAEKEGWGVQDRYKELWERLSEKNCSLETLERMIDGVIQGGEPVLPVHRLLQIAGERAEFAAGVAVPQLVQKEKDRRVGEGVPTGKGTVPL